MGYSISFQPKSKKDGDKMIAFMKEHGHSIDFLMSGEECELVGPFWADGARGLSYCNRKGHLGFDYSGSPDSEYCWILLRWMALKIGVKREGKCRLLYDGHEWSPIGDEYDELGMPKLLDKRNKLFWKMYGDLFKRIKEEMSMLNDAWNKDGCDSLPIKAKSVTYEVTCPHCRKKFNIDSLKSNWPKGLSRFSLTCCMKTWKVEIPVTFGCINVMAVRKA